MRVRMDENGVIGKEDKQWQKQKLVEELDREKRRMVGAGGDDGRRLLGLDER